MIVRERIEFERGIDPKSKMGLGLVTVEFQFMNVLYDDEAWEEGIYQLDLEDEDTYEVYENLKKIGVRYKIIPDLLNDDQPYIQITGTREQLAKVCEIYFGEPQERFLPLLKKWDGRKEEDFWRMINRELSL